MNDHKNHECQNGDLHHHEEEHDSDICPVCGEKMEYEISDEDGYGTLKGYWDCLNCGSEGTALFNAQDGNNFICHEYAAQKTGGAI